ncbi:metal ABC transporter permease [Cytophaga hutchinsonii]|jgi:manganese/zinc/iron transport system permease protein|uniref:Mn2+/Zn2+ ABC transporter, permease n=1 Tax=Cytophaga hutchinsonii (strain ATCC 33406 / DSM 1761 / CIP 103989 / NBRC 15051 / NCIMB 9469 / D465) TaxID=269798 RepID=A0A6N4SS80_CYTH3|nr:metal ABC transporter permease [Cytophaga hutchinsonii]ABG59294.1 Mn2+/Zn2+ ABC transporter, permease [Cytophaga hutchinsonii ATCC 33406]
MNDLYIILTGILVAVSCSILGTFLVLRKMAMVGDAISHAVLPGIVLSFFITGSRDSIWMLVGAGLMGIFTTLIIEWLHKKTKLQEDASIGVTFTFLFALGVLLISYFAENIDLDQECVLYGEIAYVPLNTLLIGGVEIPKAIVMLAVVLILITAIIFFFFKEWVLTTFDAPYAASIGMSTVFWNYLLMSMVSFTTVASFESVGAILVVAFLVVPAAAAYLVTESLRNTLFLAIIFGILSSVIGYYSASALDVSISGAMAAAAGCIFIICFIIQLITKRITSSPSIIDPKESVG